MREKFYPHYIFYPQDPRFWEDPNVYLVCELLISLITYISFRPLHTFSINKGHTPGSVVLLGYVYRYNGIIISIYNDCEGRIEKSAPRIAVWHLEACRLMTNGDSEGGIFLSYPHTDNGFFSCSPQFLFIYFF